MSMGNLTPISLNEVDLLHLLAKTAENFEHGSTAKALGCWVSFVSNHEEFNSVLQGKFYKIKDMILRVSSMQKLLKEKLNLEDHTKVNIICCGQALDPTSTIKEVANIWVSNNIPVRIKAANEWTVEEVVIKLHFIIC